VKNILEGTTGMHPANCDDQFKKIVHCMAGEKNAQILMLPPSKWSIYQI
jgi:hypothetical protein